MFLLNILIFWLMKMLTCSHFETGLDFLDRPQYRFRLENSGFFDIILKYNFYKEYQNFWCILSFPVWLNMQIYALVCKIQ